MKFRYVVSALVLVSLTHCVGLGQSAAQLTDPNAITTHINTETIGSVVPVIAAGGNDTLFFLYSTTAGLSTTNPRTVRVQIFATDGTQQVSNTVKITAQNQSTIVSAVALGATADGVAVLAPVTSEGADTTGHYGGSALYVDGNAGTYERPVVVGRKKSIGQNWPAFNDQHVGTYIVSGSVVTRLHIVCPGPTSGGVTSSAFTVRLFGLGDFTNLGTNDANNTKSILTQVFDAAGALVTTTTIGCASNNFRNRAATDISTAFSTGVAGIFAVNASRASTYSTASLGDIIVWRLISILPFAFDARLHLPETTAEQKSSVNVKVGRGT